MVKQASAYAGGEVSNSPLFADSLEKSIAKFEERSKPLAVQYNNTVKEGTAYSSDNKNLVAVATMDSNCLPTMSATCIGATCVGPTCSGLTCGATCASTCLITCGATCGATCLGATCIGPTCSGLTCGATCASTCLITCGGATCGATCLGATCLGPTCVGATCGATCSSTCLITCSGVTCAATCLGPTCLGPTCVGATCGATCAATCAATCSSTCGSACTPDETIEIKRLWGQDRYETSAQIALNGWMSGSYFAVLATGDNYPDALGAAPLAKKFNAPILLTEKDVLNANTTIVLTTLDVKHVFIVGGTGVVSSGIEDTLHSMGIVTTRLWGQDRYETAVEVAKYLGGVSEIFITVGDDFPDALSIGPVAANKSAPILLTERGRLPDSVKNYIQTHSISKIYVIGDSSIISDGVVSGLSNVERIGGQNKYQRNINVINRFISEFDLNAVCIATGDNFPDALSGSAFAAPSNSPIILVSASPSTDTTNFINIHKDTINVVYIFGGAGVVPDNLVNSLFN